MTRVTDRDNVAQAVSELASRAILLGGMAPDKFLPVLTTFGPMPDDGQRELAERLVDCVELYRTLFSDGRTATR